MNPTKQPKQPKPPKVKPPTPEKYIAFIAACLELGIQMPICSSNGGEVIFAKYFGRDWRTDYLFENPLLGIKLAVEIEGGTWTNGAHNRGSGFVKNIQKYNAYAMLNYKLLRFTAQQAKNEPMTCAKWINNVLYGTLDAQLLEMPQAEKLASAKIAIKAKVKKQAQKEAQNKPLKSTPQLDLDKAVLGMLEYKKSKSIKPSSQSKLWMDIHTKQNPTD